MPLPRLTVAVLTFRRPEQLGANLNSVVREVQRSRSIVDARVLVVDNDPAASARHVALAPRSVPVEYVHEPRPGIAAARNRALEESSQSRLLAFIDDDELAQTAWLSSLVATWQATGADAVAGRVVSEMPTGLDPWVAAGDIFRRQSRPTGTRLAAAATNNLLLDLATVRRLDLRFDERLGLSGGEDNVFTTLLTRAGGLIVWCEESVALDRVPRERATRAWIRHRIFSHGNVLQRTRLILAPSPRRRFIERVRGIVGGCARILLGTGRMVWGLAGRNLRHRVRGERGVLRGVGVLAGAFGYHHHEYRRPDRGPGDPLALG